MPLISLVILFILPFLTSAAHYPLQVRRSHNRIRAPANVSSQTAIKNIHNAEYVANITVGGATRSVLLDTGSSDFWLTGSVPGAKDTGSQLSLSYAIGKVSGDIYTAPCKFAGESVADQAFILAKDASTFAAQIANQGYQGLLGLGPNSGSKIRKSLGSPKGDSIMNRIFSTTATSDNYVTLLLDRINDPANNVEGQLTISEIVKGYENITNQPKLPVNKLLSVTSSDQHWQILGDKDKSIVGPDGQVIDVNSIDPLTPSGQLVAVLDSGFTFPQVSRTVSDAIYGRVPGANFSVNDGLWLIPCSTYLEISFNFGGVNFPIHPLDTVSSDFAKKDANGNALCVGAFQPITTAFSLLGTFDIILGMGFLRNTYTLLNFGDFISGSSTDPFIQLLPLTSKSDARTDFINVRLGGKDTISSQTLLPPEQGKTSPMVPGEKKAHLVEKIISRWPYIVGGVLAGVAVIAAVVVWRCCVRSRNKKNGTSALHSKKNVIGSKPSTGRHLSVLPSPLAPTPRHDTQQFAPYNEQKNVEFLQQTYGHPGAAPQVVDLYRHQKESATSEYGSENTRYDGYDDQHYPQHTYPERAYNQFGNPAAGDQTLYNSAGRGTVGVEHNRAGLGAYAQR